MMFSEAGRRQVRAAQGHELDQQDALAQGLLLEAVEVITQASGLLGDREACAALSRHADDLTRLAGELVAGPPGGERPDSMPPRP